MQEVPPRFYRRYRPLTRAPPASLYPSLKREGEGPIINGEGSVQKMVLRRQGVFSGPPLAKPAPRSALIMEKRSPHFTILDGE